jgi:replicative DNA helicase
MSLSDENDTFAQFGVGYQEKVTAALIQDPLFAEQMADVINPEFFELRYLQEVVRKFYEHKLRYKTYPSTDVLGIMIRKEEDLDGALESQVEKFLDEGARQPLNGDMGFIQASSLEFCKKQAIKEAMVKAIESYERSDYEQIQKLMRDALAKGGARDLGHEYMNEFHSRCEKSARFPISTGWPVLDNALNGGWERSTLTTFIAPTGAGKSMFLSNVSAAAIAQGLNSLYVSCEMAEYKIGLRHDAYFSGVAINDVPQNAADVQAQATAKVKGRLFIKEFPTKTATVQTIRSYMQRLKATKDFVPDVLVVDYADLLRGSRQYGDKRFELEGVYEELRALSQEFNIVVVTADQTNRSGLDMEVVTIAQIGESYAKATVCDVIITISRRAEDKQMNTGRLFLAKSRLGQDGIVFPFLLNTSTVKVTILEQGVDPVALFLENNKNLQNKMAERHTKLMNAKANLSSVK